MWTCPKCLYENSDRQASCAQCGAVRTQRRFSQPAVQNAPMQQRPTQDFSRDGQRTPRSGGRSARPPEMVLPPLSKSAKLLRGAGVLLCLLLPLLCLLLCIRQFDSLYAALVPLLTGSADKTLTGYLCYALYAACALLLCFLPGLFALTSTGKYKRRNTGEDKRLL
ncbi:MAG: hypothetical protein E7326_07100 [Clostridiales bacterium]|nr:hypothetical protein [Clostridiales bacterium]